MASNVYLIIYYMCFFLTFIDNISNHELRVLIYIINFCNSIWFENMFLLWYAQLPILMFMQKIFFYMIDYKTTRMEYVNVNRGFYRRLTLTHKVTVKNIFLIFPYFPCSNSYEILHRTRFWHYLVVTKRRNYNSSYFASFETF